MRCNRKILLIIALAIMFCACRVVRFRPHDVQNKVFLPLVVFNLSSGKRGVGLTGSYNAVDNLAVSWYYTWWWYDQWVPPGQYDSRFVPMIRGPTELPHLDQAMDFARRGDGWLLGFNEPNEPEPYGCDISPEEGAAAWHAIEQGAEGVRLVSPAPSQRDYGWLWRMVDEYERLYGTKPRFDAIGVHFYTGFPVSVSKVKDYLTFVRRQAVQHGYSGSLWLTEFAGACWLPYPASGNEGLMSGLIPWLEEQDWIARYAWFASYISGDEPWGDLSSCSLTDGDGQPNKLGDYYRGVNLPK